MAAVLLASAVAVLYLLAVRSLRHKRVRWLHEQFKRPSLSELTLQDGQALQLYLYQLEFPFIAQKALEFALFRTYGIPSVSSLLKQTRQFSTKQYSAKRLVDTAVIIIEMVTQPPGSLRSTGAIARMNYIHSIYRRQITNDDKLYTLSLFLLEPIRWINRYEWRQLTPLEIAGMSVFWKRVGDAMKIDFAELPSAKEGWRDGLAFYEEILEWSERYEKFNMVPAESNFETANHTTNLLLWRVPASMKAFGSKVVSALMDVRLRRAMLYADPPGYVQTAVNALFSVRKLILRHLTLPRPESMRRHIIEPVPCPDGRVQRRIWDQEPWYVANTFANRWLSVSSWIDWSAGRPIPGDDGDKFMPGGYKMRDLGPRSMSGHGHEEATKDEVNIYKAMVPNATIDAIVN